MDKILRVMYFGLTVIFIAAIATKGNAQDKVALESRQVSLQRPNNPPCPLPKPIILGNMELCSGGVDTLTATGGTSYVWAPGGQITSSITVSIVGTTTYTVTATNGCGSHDTTITINLGPAPVATANVNNSTICAGDSVTLTAGGGGRYVWNTGSTLSTFKVAPLVNTTYTVYVYADSTTCMDSSEVSVVVNPIITSNIFTASDTVCLGNSVTLFVASSSGSPNYIWDDGETTSSITVTPDSTTTYYVFVIGQCADDSIAHTITVLNPMITIASVDTVCKGTVVTVTAGGASTYLWNNGSTLNPATYTINSDSLVSVGATTGGCTARDHKTIYVYLLTSQIFNDTICAGSTTIGVSVTGGEAPYTYLWNNGITWDSAGPFTVTPPPNVYICAVKDGCGNAALYDINLVARPGSIPAFIPIPDTINAGGFIDFVNFSKGAVSYIWNMGDGTTNSDSAPYHEYNAAGIYQVCMVAINGFGCKDTLCEDVFAYNEPIVVPNVFTPNGDGINDVFHITAGGFQTYSFIIYNRWGQEVFAADSPDIDWTGRSSSGVLEVTGIYYYVLNATDYQGNVTKLNGYIQLIR